MGPSRRPTNTFVDFAPTPLRAIDTRAGRPSTSGWRASLLLRVGLLAVATCVIAFESGGVAGPLFALIVVGCLVIEGHRMWTSAHVPRRASLRVVPASSSSSAMAPPEETATG